VPGLFPAYTTLQLKVFLASEYAVVNNDIPTNLSFALYDPSNVLLYTNNGPIAHPPTNNTAAYWFEFTVPADNLLVTTYDEANYLALVRANMASGRTITNTVQIKVK